MSEQQKPAREPISAAVVFLRAASLVAVALGAGLLWRMYAARPAWVRHVAMQELRAPRDRTAAYTLSDGSSVVLAPGAWLAVPRDMRESREVRMNGRALFRVVPAEQAPFRVLTERALVRVVGTEFVVDAAGSYADVRVGVRSGRVSLRRAGAEEREAVEVRAGSVGVLGLEGRPAVVRGARADTMFAWASR